MNLHFLTILLLIMSPMLLHAQERNTALNWTVLSPIPDDIGFAGAYIATAQDRLFMMGGANFPDGKAPWEGGKKVWTDRVFMLAGEDNEWAEVGVLPRPIGYGAVASYQDAMYIAGGSDEHGHVTDVYRLTWTEGSGLSITSLVPLPHALANCASVVVGDYWYILGGIQEADSKSALNVCWRMNLSQPDTGWELCAQIPGEGRMLAVAGNLNGKLLVASGVSLRDGNRNYLSDAYILEEDNHWQKIGYLPEAVAAAAGPAWYESRSEALYIFGGDNGKLVSQDLRERHPGFSNRAIYYDMKVAEWKYVTEAVHLATPDQGQAQTWVPVTTGMVPWRGGVAIVSGEIRPGVRTPQVLFGRP